MCSLEPSDAIDHLRSKRIELSEGFRDMTREDSNDPIREEPAFGEPDRLQARLPYDRRALNMSRDL